MRMSGKGFPGADQHTHSRRHTVTVRGNDQVVETMADELCALGVGDTAEQPRHQSKFAPKHLVHHLHLAATRDSVAVLCTVAIR